MSRNLTFGSVLAALALGAASVQSKDVLAAWEAGGVKARGYLGKKASGVARSKRIARKRKNIRARGKK